MREAIVIAAGEGVRLRPLTERWPKPLLPIDGRPVIATLLRELRLAGCERVTVVTGHLAEQVEALVGDGRGFALEVRYVRQPRADGSADAVRRALAAGTAPPLVVAGADTLFGRGDIGRFMVVAAAADGAIAVRRKPPPSPPHRAAVRVRDGLVERVLDDDPANPLAGAPLWALGPPLVPLLDGLEGPPFELARALQRGVDAGLRIAGVEIGPTRDLTHPVDLVEENFPYLSSSGSS
jgi:GTP:adenosylcobinamide-phosphate guanylyltransferase